MRGTDRTQSTMFSYVSPEARIPEDHPLRATREMTNRALARLDRKFRKLYSRTGRPSVPPEQLLRALLLQVLYSIRSERMLMEQLEYNLLFRWFVGLEMDDRVWDVTVFTKNRDRLLEGEIAESFLQAVLEQARAAGLLSDEHFTVDGTLIEAWAGQKSFRPKDEDGGSSSSGARSTARDFHGERRKNDTHASTTDPDARLLRKGRGKEAKLCFLGHVITENRNGLVVATETTLATGTAEREASVKMMKRVARARRSTLGGDKNYDTQEHVKALRALGVTPHVAQNARNRRSAIDDRTTTHAGYEISQRKRKCVEQVFGWGKTVGPIRKAKHRGVTRVGWMFSFTQAAYNLVRMRPLLCST
ncbi:MAG: IS5 family transposase [Myxococcales bacterium]|nr:IS5 family transposase [Myxococcales bacterium]